MPRFNPNPAFAFLFQDPARQFELFCLANMISWSLFFWRAPEAVSYDHYPAFTSAPAWAWAVVFGSMGVFQMVAMFSNLRWRYELRSVALALGTGLWLLVAVSHFISNSLTAADVTYLLLAIGCASCGGYLAWKAS